MLDNPDVVISFEKYYNQRYAWEMARKRRGYYLKKQVDKENKLVYVWEHPQKEFLVWKAAYEYFRGEK